VTGPRPGRLIALEGVDGSGKTTQARRLAQRLGALLTFEPGATELGRSLRALLLDPDGGGPSPRAEALLMAADRAQHVDEVVGPALAEGRWVVTDRFSGSTLAYQGWGRQLGADVLRPLVGWAAGGRWPDLSVLVDLPVDEAVQRLGTGRPDRLERLDPAFFERVRKGFLAEADADRWVVVDGRPDEETVAAAIERAVRDRLGWPSTPRRVDR